MAIILIVHARVPQKRFAPWRLKFFVNFVWKRSEVYPRGGARTVNVANLTNGYAAEKGISKVVSDGEWKPYSNFDTKISRIRAYRVRFLL